MYLLKRNGQQEFFGLLRFTFIDQELHASFYYPLIVKGVYPVQPLLTFG